MATEKLTFVIEAEDRAKATLQSIEGNVSSLGTSIKENMATIAGLSATAGLAFAGIASFAKSSIEAGQESIKNTKQLESVLRSTGGVAGVTADKALELASSLSKVTDYEDDAVLSAQNLLLTFTNIKSDIFPQVTELALDMSTAFGQDLKSSSLQLGKALNDPIAGLGALGRIGVQFTDQQKDMIKGFVESGNVAKAQAIILEEVGRQVGGSARATSDPFIRMKNQLGEVSEEIGKALVPALVSLAQAVLPVVEKIADFIAQHPKLSAGIVAVIAGVTGLIAIVGALSIAMTALSAVSLPIVGIILAIVAVVAVIVAVFIYWDEIVQVVKETLIGFGIIIKEALSSAFMYIKDMVNGIWNFIQDILTSIQNTFTVVWNAVKTVTTTVFDFIKNYFTIWGLATRVLTVENMQAIYTVIVDVWTRVKSFFADVWNSITSTFKSAIDYLSNLIDSITNKISSMMNAVKSVGVSIGNGVSTAFNSVAGVFKRATGGSVTPNTPYVVGENGQELFVPNTYGSILNAGQLQGLGGGGINITISGNSFMGDEGVAEKIGNELVKILKLNTKL